MILRTFIILSISLVSFNIGTAQMIPQDGLQLYLPFNETLRNMVHPWLLEPENSGTEFSFDYRGVADNAAFMDGSGYIRSSNKYLNYIDDFTIALWLKPELWQSSSSRLFLFDKFRLSGNISTIKLVPNNKYTEYYISSSYFPTDEWTYLTITKSGDEIGFFVNGIKIAHNSKSHPHEVPKSDKIIVGANLSSLGNFYTGGIDEVVFYNRGITSEEVQTLYDSYGANVTYISLWGNVDGTIYHNEKNVGIGTKYPAHKLTVAGSVGIDGSVRAHELNARSDVWPDYVFRKDYNLPSLEYLEEYIRDHGKLPKIPSESQVLKEGISLKDNSILLLEKVEELTLLMIKMEERIEKLEKN